MCAGAIAITHILMTPGFWLLTPSSGEQEFVRFVLKQLLLPVRRPFQPQLFVCLRQGDATLGRTL
jgi:hypothetical protein